MASSMSVLWNLLGIIILFQISLKVTLSSHPGTLLSGEAHGNDDIRDVYIVPPRLTDEPYPLMLHESDVIHYVNPNKEFLLIGMGSFADITLGELRGSGVPVAVKKFRDTSFSSLLHEVRMNRFAEILGFTPKLIGLLPTGPLTQNVSIVYEYVANAKNLLDLMQGADFLGVLQWVQICHEIAVNLHQLHQRGVLFNDLHRKNILVQNIGHEVKTYIIDFGFSTYKTGRLFTHDATSLKGYDHLAPELYNYTYTSVATEVYAYGYVLDLITTVYPEPSLRNLARWCMSVDPRDRPEMPEVIAKIERIYLEIAKHVGCDNEGGNTCQDLIRFQYVKRAVDKSKAVFSSKYDNVNEGFVSRKKIVPQLQNMNGHLNCITAIPVLNDKDFVPGVNQWITRYHEYSDNAIRLAVLNDQNQTVVVKEFYKVDFELIRQETCITMYLASEGVAPKVIGFTIEYKRLSEIAFVQEFFGNGVTLESFVTNTQLFDWDISELRKRSEYVVDEDGVLFLKRDVCQVNSKNIFMSIQSDYTWPLCRTKSYRQKILEKVSILLILHLQTAHDSGILINNFKLDNIIVKWNETEIGITDVTRDPGIGIRLIDLSATTSLSKGKKYKPMPLIENRHAYVAPEVVLGRATSKESDVYSACVAVRSTLSDYFSSYDVANAFEGFRAKRRQGCASNESVFSTTNHSRQHWTLANGHTSRSYDSPYSRLQHLLHQCLHNSDLLRPTTQELLQSLRRVSILNFDGLWL
nr:dual specificity protein kinase shkC isoform X1 [Biomphalaria glabrata]